MKKHLLVDGGCYEGGGCVAASDLKLCSALRANCKDKHYILNPEWKPVSQRLRELTRHVREEPNGPDMIYIDPADVDELAAEFEKEEGEG